MVASLTQHVEVVGLYLGVTVFFEFIWRVLVVKADIQFIFEHAMLQESLT